MGLAATLKSNDIMNKTVPVTAGDKVEATNDEPFCLRIQDNSGKIVHEDFTGDPKGGKLTFTFGASGTYKCSSKWESGAWIKVSAEKTGDGYEVEDTPPNVVIMQSS
jgi:hypothetical protein